MEQRTHNAGLIHNEVHEFHQNSSLCNNHSETDHRKQCRISYFHFQEFPGARPDHRNFQDLGLITGICRPGVCDSRTFQDPYERCKCSTCVIPYQVPTESQSSPLQWLRAAYRHRQQQRCQWSAAVLLCWTPLQQTQRVA